MTKAIVPLYDATTLQEQDIVIETDEALITRIADRGRDRHAKEAQFQAYEHYLSFYWEHRTATIEIIDTVAKGGDTITFNVVTQYKLSDNEAELRFFYRGINTIAEYHNNGVMTPIDEFNYTRSVNQYASLNGERRPLQIGDRMEFEMSQFLDDSVPNGRANYYGTTYLYIVGEGIVPWETRGDFNDKNSEREDSFPIPVEARLGGDTTVHRQISHEPDNYFIQMATNIGSDNAQPFVLGRRLLHTDFVTGEHDEAENPVFAEMIGKSGPHYINARCSDCHQKNGRAAPRALGESLDKWVFKVGDSDGNPDPAIGRVLQPQGSAESEGDVSIAFWTEENGLRAPNYDFTNFRPATFSARIAPQLVGLGLLEAIPEEDILAQEDIGDADGDGISGKAQRVLDPLTNDLRLGRFGWKAGNASLQHQVAGALNTDMGITTSVRPDPDCGSEQNDCGESGPELSDEELNQLVKYVALLGVHAQRDYDNTSVQSGKTIFSEIGCASCHTPSWQTGDDHPFGELRNQTIYPYTDMLLHDMGPGLADTLGEGDASGSEWRTTPLWGIGLSACVTGGVTNPTGQQGDEICVEEASYLHDGRARSIEEAILWHGGEGEASKLAFEALSVQEKQAVIDFLNSL